MTRVLQALLILVFFSVVYAQSEWVAVTLVLPDGSSAPFEIEIRYDEPYILYAAGGTSPGWGNVEVSVGGGVQQVPFQEIVRADLREPGSETVWEFQLADGRTFEGAVEASDAVFWLNGENEFGAYESLMSHPRDPEKQPFTSVIFHGAAESPGRPTTQQAARADADSVNLRNGDVLTGDILTSEFTVQASYGTLTFAQDQLASITIESEDGRTDQVILSVGDSVSGVLQNETIDITLTSGATVMLEKGNIASITFFTE